MCNAKFDGHYCIVAKADHRSPHRTKWRTNARGQTFRVEWRDKDD